MIQTHKSECCENCDNFGICALNAGRFRCPCHLPASVKEITEGVLKKFDKTFKDLGDSPQEPAGKEKSKCCGAKIVEAEDDDKNYWEVCSKCGKPASGGEKEPQDTEWERDFTGRVDELGCFPLTSKGNYCRKEIMFFIRSEIAKAHQAGREEAYQACREWAIKQAEKVNTQQIGKPDYQAAKLIIFSNLIDFLVDK